jgi:hypothetical protein
MTLKLHNMAHRSLITASLSARNIQGDMEDAEAAD